MPKILLALSVLFMLGSAVLGYLNKGKLSQAVEARVAAESRVNAAAAEATSAKKALADSKTKASSETSKVTEIEQQLSAKEAELSKANADITNLNVQLTEKAAGLEAITAERDALLAKPTVTPEIAIPEAGPQVAELNAQIEALKAEKQIIGDKLVAAESKTQELSTVLARQKNAMVAKGLEGQVIAVNQAWGFVVLNLGDRSGVVNNAEMVVTRDGDRVGRVKITSVEPSNSIADIVANSVSEGQRVMPGDRVIYTGN